MTISTSVPVAFLVLLLVSLVVGLSALGYLTYYRFKNMLREKFSLGSVIAFEGLTDFSWEAGLVPLICIAIAWPSATYFFERRVDISNNLTLLLIDFGFLLTVPLSLRTVPRIKKISATTFAIATAVYCIIFILLSTATSYFFYQKDHPVHVHNPAAVPSSQVMPMPNNIPGEFDVKSDPIAQQASKMAPRSCINLVQQGQQLSLNPASCGSAQSNFRIVQIAPTIEGCVDDIDKALGSRSLQYALCLDYDWSADHCMRITSDQVDNTACTSGPASRFQNVIIGVTDDSGCAQSGYIHAVRKFTVCTEAVPGKEPRG